MTEKDRRVLRLDQTIRHLQHLRKDLVIALEVQYDRPSGRPEGPEEPVIRSRGVYSDPTADTATDTSRLRLRRELDSITARLDRLEQEAYETGIALGWSLRKYLHEEIR